MILGYSSVLQGIGVFGTAVATILAAYATYQSRKVEQRSATQAETQQAFDMQDRMMKNVQDDNDRLRKRQDEMHKMMNEIQGRLLKMTQSHRHCEEQLSDHQRRLHEAEARIAELGG